MDQNPIDQFVDQLLEQAGLTNTTPEKKEEYRQNMLKLVQQKLGIEMMKLLPESAVDQFVELAEQEQDSQVLLQFFQSHIPNFETSVQGILAGCEEDFKHTLQQFASFSQGS